MGMSHTYTNSETYSVAFIFNAWKCYQLEIQITIIHYCHTFRYTISKTNASECLSIFLQIIAIYCNKKSRLKFLQCTNRENILHVLIYNAIENVSHEREKKNSKVEAG